MSANGSCEFKVWAFLKRNTALLSHDEYRAGHVGYHCGNTRRLKAIRGYTVNIHDEDSGLGEDLADTGSVTVLGEPAHFLSLWDGFPAVHFDSRQHWLAAAAPEATRATAAGLAFDPDWTLSDGPYLFDPVSEGNAEFRSCHTRVHETVIKPVLRAERRPYKLIQFFRAADGLSPARFRERLFAEYLPACAALGGLNGLVANLRDPDIDAAVRGYYPDSHWCFSAGGRAFREQFFALWDGGCEFFFDDAQAFLRAREAHPRRAALLELERTLFAALWYVSVDENIIVMPDRAPAPAFYHR